MKCKDCAKYKGDCGHHFRDTNGHILYDVPSESMHDGAIDSIPYCFEPSTEFQKRINMENAREIAKYPIDVITLALDLKKKNEPKIPLNRQYSSVDFCTYGDCPTCGAKVSGDSIGGHSDEECPNCGQKLNWR